MTTLFKGLSFDLRHIKHISPVAVVSDLRWIKPLSRLVGIFFSPQIRIFRADAIEQARMWLRHA